MARSVRGLVSASAANAFTIEVLTASTDSENIANGDSGATYTTDGSASQTVTEGTSAQGYAYGAYEYQAWGDTWGTIALNLLVRSGLMLIIEPCWCWSLFWMLQWY